MGPTVNTQERMDNVASGNSGPLLDASFRPPVPPRPSTSTVPSPVSIHEPSNMEAAPILTTELPVDLPKPPISRRRLIGVGALILGIIVIGGIIGAILFNKKPIVQSSLTSQNIKPQTTSLSGLSAQLSSSAQPVNTLTVNGHLAVTDSLHLEPSTKPSTAAAGELYYDQATNKLGYYDGKGFVYLQGGSSSVINNITNNITNATNVLNTTNITNISSTSVSNNTIGLNGSGTTGQIALFGSSSTLAGSILTQSGTAIAAAGTMSLKSGSNTTQAFQVQNASGNGLLTADTTNNAVVLGNDGTVSGVTLRGGAAAGSNLTEELTLLSKGLTARAVRMVETLSLRLVKLLRVVFNLILRLRQHKIVLRYQRPTPPARNEIACWSQQQIGSRRALPIMVVR